MATNASGHAIAVDPHQLRRVEHAVAWGGFSLDDATAQVRMAPIRLAASEARSIDNAPADKPVQLGAPFDRAEFFGMLAGAGYSLKTCRVYATALAQVANVIATDGHTLDDLPAAVLRRYADSQPKTRSSRALLRSSLTAYWRLVGRLETPIAAIRVPTKPRMVCRALEPEAATELAAAAQARGDRKGLAVLIALYTGLRRSEIAGLRWSDVDEHGWLTIVGKGDVTGCIPVHPVVLGAMADLRSVTSSATQQPKVRHGADFVFPGRGGGHINPTTLYNHVRDVARAAGLGDIPVHVLRHTCLATALDITRDLRAVQELARHARPETTAGYTRVRRDRLIETVVAIDYGGRP